MNLASGLAQREREGPLWSLPHRLGAKTTFVVPPPPDPSRQRSRSASSSSSSNSSDEDDESSSQPTTASGASDPAPLQPQQTDSVTDEPGNSPAAEGSLWRLHRPTSSTQLFRANSSFVSRLHLAKRLDGHRGCVNSIHWNAEGTLLITGSDDCKLNIYSPGPHYKQLHNIRTGHSRNIFCAKFVPYTNDNTVVSCGMDGEIRCTQLGRERASALIYSSPMHMVLKMSFLPGSGSVFLSTHQDGTVRLFDLRLRENNPENIAVDLRSERGERVAVNSLAMCPLGSYKFALACADPIVRLYDVRMTGGASTGQNITENDRYKCLTKYCPRSVLETHSKRDNYFSINVTGVDFNELGEIAATYSRVDAYVFSTQPGTHHKELTSETAPNIDSAYYQVQTGYVQSYKGHKNVRTFLKEISFLGGNDYVTTGSDCGHAFVWHKQTGKLVNMLKADDSVVNGVAPHPHLPYLATCGIDSDGKVWEPGSEYTFNPEKAERVVGRNGGSDAEDDGDGVRISLLNLWNFLTMMRSREAGQRRDQEREGDGQAGEGQAQQEEEEEEEEEVEEEEEEETTAQLIMDLEMVGVADEIRNRGNRLFKAEDYDAAEAEYSRALEHLFVLESPYEEVMRRKKRSRLLCLLNRAACNLKRQQWQRVVDDSTEVLAVQPSNVKALFRRAKALLELKHFDRSLRDILLAEQLSPGSEEIGALHQQLREARSSEPSLEAGGEEAAPEEVMDVEEKGAADDAAGGGDPMNES